MYNEKFNGKNRKTSNSKMKGPHSKDMLGDRMKFLESMTTEQYLLPKVPMYARLDGRCFHKFTSHMEHPFDEDFKNVMQSVAAFLVEETHAKISYVQSDEISLGWLCPEDSYFEGRVFKLQSVLASIATSKFVYECMKIPRLAEIIDHTLPSFDCRVMSIPTVQELANMFLFRENDAAKNGISQLATGSFSSRELYKKNSDDKVEMLRDIGVEYEDIDEHYRKGTYFHRVNRRVELSDDVISRIPEDKRKYDEDGKMYAVRSFVEKMNIPYRLTECANKAGVLFNNETFITKDEKYGNRKSNRKDDEAPRLERFDDTDTEWTPTEN